MIIKKIGARSVRDSRGKGTIQVIVRTSRGSFKTSAPAGKSKGRFEVRSYAKGLNEDIKHINNLDVEKINDLRIDSFEDLKYVERMVLGDIGGNSLFALEASLLKGMAREKGKELWEFLGGHKKKICPIGNAIGGGLHSRGVKGKKPDFQEFLFIGNGGNFKESVKINEMAYGLCRKFLKPRGRNDEGAWETGLSNHQTLAVMKNVQGIIKKKGFKVDIGLDIACSSFYKHGIYYYKSPSGEKNRDEQIEYISDLINGFGLYYIEDVLNESDFEGFKKLKKKVEKCLIVGDDLTATNIERVKKAIKMKAVDGVIIKPNQIGSLLEVKEVIDLCKKKGVKTIISHRSGETMDNTIADLAVGFGVDFIKTGIYGSVRRVKLKRLVKIEKSLK